MKKLNKNGFLNALGTLVYIALVATLMQNGDRLFGEMSNFIGPIGFLLLFSLSAVIVGGLIIGQPLMRYLDGQKKEAVALLVSTVLWLAGFTVITLFIAYLLK